MLCKIIEEKPNNVKLLFTNVEKKCKVLVDKYLKQKPAYLQ